MQQDYRFAYMGYNGVNNAPTYYGVRKDYTLFVSSDWKDFFAETGCYCDKSLVYACIGTYKPSPDLQIYCHKNSTGHFVLFTDRLQLVNMETEVDFYAPEDCPEQRHWNAFVVYSERNSY